MKILTIGLDGGDRNIIRAMPMPNLHRILDENICLDVEEDLWSRGWTEILGGVHARESGGFYAKPKLDGTHGTTAKFNAFDYRANPVIEPLWAKLSNMNYRVGFMNLPTTIPAQEVNGFFVSGAGGGFSPRNGLPEVACFPTRIRAKLIESGYVWERRLYRGEDRDPHRFVDDLSYAVLKRTNVFASLCEDFKNDFGFIMHKATTIIQNLAFSEIEALIETKGKPSNAFQETLLRFYSQVDEQIGKLLSRVSPQQLMLVSDHGQSPRLFSINVNDWLVCIGMQAPLARPVSFVKKGIKSIARLLPKGVKKSISRTAPKLATGVGRGVNAAWERTKAFGVRYVPGMYINDQARFGGPVTSESEMDALVKEIINAFNADGQARNHGLTAREYRSRYSDAEYEPFLPDIWIDHPDSVFFEQHGKFIAPNKEYGPITSLEAVDRDMFTGIKGRHPLLCVSPALAELVLEKDDRNLTLAYNLIVRGMTK